MNLWIEIEETIHRRERIFLESKFSTSHSDHTSLNQAYEWMNEYVNEWMDEWMNMWMSEWVNEWMNERHRNTYFFQGRNYKDGKYDTVRKNSNSTQS